MINLTQHPASADQIAAGVQDLPAHDRAVLVGLLTFNVLPDQQDILHRADCVADMAFSTGAGTAMIGGALWLMAPLATALRARGILPSFAFSVRQTVEQTMPDGSVQKTAVFRHSGFVGAV